MWTVNEVASPVGKTSVRVVGRFNTKRQAYTSVMYGLGGKYGAITKNGHTYSYVKPKK